MIIIACFFALIVYFGNSSAEKGKGPFIEIELRSNHNGNITDLNVTKGNSAFYIDKNMNLTVYCFAKFPIFWTFEGPWTNTPANAEGFSVFSDDNFFESNFRMVPVPSATGNYACRGVQNKSQLLSFYLSFPGDLEPRDAFRNILENIEEKEIIVVRPNYNVPIILNIPLIPEPHICLLNNVNGSWKLLTRDIDYDYSKYTGFHIKTYSYMPDKNAYTLCVVNNRPAPLNFAKSIKLTVVSHLSVYPKSDLVYYDSNNKSKLQFICSSDANITEFLVTYGKKVESIATNETFCVYTTKRIRKCTFPAKNLNANYGSIACKSSENTTLHEWKFMRKGTTMRFEYKRDEIHCVVPEVDLREKSTIINLECNTNDECRLREKCLLKFERPIEGCGSITKIGEHDRNTNQFIRRRYERGIVRCSHPNGFMIQETYFAGLITKSDGTRNTCFYLKLVLIDKLSGIYSDWKNADISELMELSVESENGIQNNTLIFTGEYRTFTCHISNFIFNDPPRWAYEDNRGQIIPFPEEYINSTRDQFEKSIREMTYYRPAKILFFTRNITKIVCIGYFQASMDWKNISVQVNVHDSVAPTFSESHRTVTKVSFLPTQKLTLECSPKAKPKATISWTFNNSTNLPNELQGLEDILTFPQHKAVFNGMYSCYAENVAGNATKVFQVKFEDARQWTALWVSLSVGLFAFFWVTSILWRNLKKTKKALKTKSFTKDDIDEFIKGNPELAARFERGNEFAHYIPYKRECYEISRNNFDLGDGIESLLGSGEFGIVFKAKYFTENSTLQHVAVKAMKPTTDVNYFKSLLKELKIMIYIGSHENIVNLIGACTENLIQREIYILMELCVNGSLLSYLHKCEQDWANNTTENVTLIDGIDKFKSLTIQRENIANGLLFLKKKHVIHGDLAARNVLVTETFTAKISDFGLSRQLLNYENYTQNKQDRMPWKWLAIESLQTQKFSHESDIWSYGVLLWEIFSMGQTPYPFQTFNDEFLQRLTQGYRLPRPKYSSTFIYNNILIELWRNEPLHRIHLNEIVEYLNNNSPDYANDKDYVVLEDRPFF